MKILLFLFFILIVSSRGFGQTEAQASAEYTFPEKESEFSVTFPGRPTLEAVYGNQNFSVTAKFKYFDGLLQAEFLPLSVKEAKAYSKKDDRGLAEYPKTYAEASGLTETTVNVEKVNFGRIAKLIGYKNINGVRTTFEIYFCVGKHQIITLYTAGDSENYPTDKTKKFLNSLQFNPNYDPKNPTAADKNQTSDSDNFLNGRAVSLPRPEYPAAARAVRASGAVRVQIRIDENGNVIDARALGGHPLLRQVAEKAALQAKFNPLYMFGQKIKVTGLVVYDFVP